MATRRGFGTLRKLPSGRWQASYVGPDGKRHKAPTTFTRRADGETWLAVERRELETPGRWVAPETRHRADEAGAETLASYAARNIEARATRARKPLRPTTASHYRQLLRLSILPQLGNYALDEITPAVVADWHASLPPGTPTQNGHAYNLLRSLMRDALDEGRITEQPCRIRGAGKPAPAREPEALTARQDCATVLVACSSWRNWTSLDRSPVIPTCIPCRKA